MIFNNGDNVMCFSEVNVPYNYDPVIIAFEEVIKKHGEFSVKPKLVNVKIADKDVTNEVLGITRDYISNKVKELDDQLPF